MVVSAELIGIVGEDGIRVEVQCTLEVGNAVFGEVGRIVIEKAFGLLEPPVSHQTLCVGRHGPVEVVPDLAVASDHVPNAQLIDITQESIE